MKGMGGHSIIHPEPRQRGSQKAKSDRAGAIGHKRSLEYWRERVYIRKIRDAILAEEMGVDDSTIEAYLAD